MMRLWPTRGQAADTAAWAAHEQRADAVVKEVLDGRIPMHVLGPDSAWVSDWAGRLFAGPPEVAGSALMLLVRACVRDRLPWAVTMCLGDISWRQWRVPREDSFVAARMVTRAPDAWHASWAFTVVAVLLSRTTASTPLSESEAVIVRDVIASLEHRANLRARERNSLRSRLLRMLPNPAPGAVDTSAIVSVDGWAAALLPDLPTSAAAEKVNALLRHLTTANGSKPTNKWLAAAAGLVEDDDIARVLRLMLERLVTADPVTRPSAYGGCVPLVLDVGNTDIARAAVWATIPIAQAWVVPTLEQLAVRDIRQSGLVGWLSGDKVPNACIVALGRIASPGAVAALQLLADSTKHNGFRKRAAAALSTAAAASGLSPSQLVEHTIRTGGLDHDGTLTITAGHVTARATVDDRLKITTRWQTLAGWVTRPPAGASAADCNQVKRAVKGLKDLIRVERRRIEGLLATDRSWDVAEWRRYHLDHPLTGQLTRRLIWTFETGATRAVGLPVDAGTLRTTRDDLPLPSAATVRLWHPATATTDEVSAWRDWLLREQFVQPFKQAFREVYLLTPAELETRTYSNRFAAHVLRYQQLYALFKERAWVANYLGPHDGGYEGKARHEFPDAGLTAVFEHFQVDPEAGAFRTDLCSTDRVWFFRTHDRATHAVPLDEVLPLVFTEAMRDVDLFVGVTSIALDPNWADRGGDPYYDYWLAASFGALTATAQVRRDVLAALLPKLKIADRVELGDRYVRVRGNRATYKIHLGSANILIEPDDRYLCIVPASKGRTTRIMLPFEGDEVLTVVLSKVLMLAADDKITDPTILAQLNRRAHR